MQQTEVLGLKVNIFSDEVELFALLESYIKSGVPHQVVTANSEMYYQAYQKDFLLADAINNSELAVIDAVGIKLALKIAGATAPLKIYPGVELAEKLLKKGYLTYLLGSAQEVLDRLNYPNIVGKHHGYFREEETSAILADIKKAKPQILLVALGAGRQEKWIAQYKNELNIPLMIGVGGALDVLAGTKKRAPQIFRKLSLEWFYRLFKEPARITRQINLLWFLVAVLKNAARKNKK